jgi:dihydroflavonol-4-reductase
VTVALVTGGRGFIGRHVVQLLHERGLRVRSLDISPADDRDVRSEQIVGSIVDHQVVARAMSGVGQVYHLAGIPDLWAADVDDFRRTNADGTRIVIEAAVRAGAARIVHTSTESILKGWRSADPPSTGPSFDRLRLSDVPGAYCRSKLMADRIASRAAAEGHPVVIVHPTMPIGPGDLRLTPPTRMILDFVNGRHPAFLDAHINLVDVRDAALGHLLAAERGRPGQRFVLGHTNVRLADLLVLVEELTGLPMAKRRVPYALALAIAAGAETWSAFTGRRPVATVAGVRLVKHPMTFDCRADWEALGASGRPLVESVVDLLRDLDRRDLVTRPLSERAVTAIGANDVDGVPSAFASDAGQRVRSRSSATVG